MAYDYKNVNRTKWIGNFKRSAKKGLELALTNFNPNTYWQCQFLILTYRGEMKDYNKLSKDFEIFMKRLKRLYKKFGYKIQSFRVNRLNESGNWHIHLLIRLQDIETGKWIAIEQKPVSPNEPNPKLNGKLTSKIVGDLWGQGNIQMFNCTKKTVRYVTNLFEQLQLEKLPKDVRIYTPSKDLDKPAKKRTESSEKYGMDLSKNN